MGKVGNSVFTRVSAPQPLENSKGVNLFNPLLDRLSLGEAAIAY